MRDFAAIDFETANSEPSSVCSVGIVIVRDGEMVDSFYSLIQPEPNYYNYWCRRVHGLCCADTDEAPVFPKVWAQIEPLIEGLPLVAHNKPFDDVVTTSRTTIMPSPMPKPAHGLQERYYNIEFNSCKHMEYGLDNGQIIPHTPY